MEHEQVAMYRVIRREYRVWPAALFRPQREKSRYKRVHNNEDADEATFAVAESTAVSLPASSNPPAVRGIDLIRIGHIVCSSSPPSPPHSHRSPPAWMGWRMRITNGAVLFQQSDRYARRRAAP